MMKQPTTPNLQKRGALPMELSVQSFVDAIATADRAPAVYRSTFPRQPRFFFKKWSETDIFIFRLAKINFN
jgi:hypothetical protein